MLMIRCPKTGEPLWTGSDASIEELVSGVVGPCPHCGDDHAWSNEDVIRPVRSPGTPDDPRNAA